MVNRIIVLLGSAVLAFFSLTLALGQSTVSADDGRALRKEIEALKAGQEAIYRELQEIKSLLRPSTPGAAQPSAPAAGRPAAAATTTETVDFVVNVAGASFKGDKNAKVTVVEFTDYQCPFCSRHFRQTWPRLEQDFVNTGKAKFVLRDLPIESIHPLAFKAAEATYCAGTGGKFWEMHDRLFENQSSLSRADLSTHAQALGLDVTAFDKCLDEGSGAAKIRRDIADSEKAGARGTPIFYVGLTEPNGETIHAVRVIRGAHPYATFKEAIEGLLAAAK